MKRIPLALAAGAAALLGAASAATAQVSNDYGIDFAVIGAPGNRAVNAVEGPLLYELGGIGPIGAVGYEYRVARTEVTASQWFEFVQAYAPYYEGSRNDPGFTSDWIVPSSFDPDQPAGYRLATGAEQLAANMSWRFAARYVNWLSNDKRPEQWAFETGVYDTSTFTNNPDGTFNDQPAHSPDARFWIPTLDELTKALYYNPDRYGEGQEGYWRHPTSSDTPPIPGYPEDGGESAAGIYFGDATRWVDVGSYPGVQSSWGLLDGSGGVSEWTEWSNGTVRGTRGSADYGGEFFAYSEQVDVFGAASPFGYGLPGLRIASSVPAPSWVTPFVLILISFRTRRNQ